ncbi:hypothetical protein CROQUDRAFT_529472 [Cronartium quercuum f. sp. fusiforme G11]|uniref:RNase H type-1 domain-containing protein n=1 Tax=Cronartium quercuum f. sp. fusiforme G11 TaxID=708437 RepID=A0A9P6NLG2_9BASI|nr:hypothetical protein CROQUDRAFT_529472 [Cronartium quercuum f. sp. fusiforme G11]
MFEEHTAQLLIDPTTKLTRPKNYLTILPPTKSLAISETNGLSPSTDHLIVFTNSSCIPSKNTAATAWCQNTNQSASALLGPAQTQGIYNAEYRGVQLGLSLILHSASHLTWRASLILDNQGIIMDL